MKKIYLVLLVIGLISGLFIGCTPTIPPVGEGESEDEDETINRVVLVELFTTGCPFCKEVEPIVEQLAEEYVRSEMILVEERPWGSPVTPEANDRYQWYLPNSDDRKTPNTFFNGSNQRIWLTGSYYLFKSKIIAELAKDSKISINVNRNENSGTTILTGKIKNISESTLSNLVINGMTFKDYGEPGQKYTVLDIFAGVKEVGISLEPDAEQSFTFTLEDVNWNTNQIHGVIFVQSSSTKEIFHAKYIE